MKIKDRKHRDLKDIQADYSKTAQIVGDTHFKMELERAKLQQFTLKLSEFKKEYDEAQEWQRELEERFQRKAQKENTTLETQATT